jgi:hypothetical protein
LVTCFVFCSRPEQVSAKPKTTTGHKEKDLATKKDLRQVQSQVLLLFLLVVIHIFVILENVLLKHWRPASSATLLYRTVPLPGSNVRPDKKGRAGGRIFTASFSISCHNCERQHKSSPTTRVSRVTLICMYPPLPPQPWPPFCFIPFFYEAVALTACSSQIERQPLTPNKLQ